MRIENLNFLNLEIHAFALSRPNCRIDENTILLAYIYKVAEGAEEETLVAVLVENKTTKKKEFKKIIEK
ncbi:MAG: hypothetical protein IKX93_05920 [Bacteroidaceae bacterium]|nr:hypothetical protein [Bacteroidaceae bacterium]